MPMITATSTADDLTLQGYDNVFRVVLRDSDQGPAGAIFAKEKLGARRVAVLDDKTAYGKGLAEAYKNKAVELGMDIVARDAFNVGDKDFSTLVTKLIAAQPDVIFIGGMYPETSLLVKQARPRGFKAVVMSGDGAYVPKLIDIAGDAAEGLIASFIAPPWDETQAAVDFVNKYKAKYGEDVKSYAPLAYDATMILAEAIKRANKADRAAIIAAMHAPDFSYKGIAASYQFDANGDVTTKQPYFYIVLNGKFELYK
jgi:branched-chain amino acid transport system substrate-binding protein